jgi:hypothetical protein
MCILQLVNLTL